MIVVDASAVIEVLLATPAAGFIAARLRQSGMGLHAPQLLDIEVVNVLRRLSLRGTISSERGREALDDFLDLPISRYGHGALIVRVWALRQSMTAYDATYVALAEALDAPLITRDRRLGGTIGHAARIEVV